MKELECTALVDRAIKKDNEAIELLYNSYYKDVLYVCSKLGLNDEDAKDIAQDAFITAFSTLPSIKDKAKFKQWVCGIASNRALNFLRHNNVLKIESIDNEESNIELPGKEKATEDTVIDNEMAAILRGVIEKLPLEQRIAVFMFYYEDMSVKEIAASYGCSESTIRSRLNYAKKTMLSEINQLEDKGVKLRCVGALPFLYLLFAMEEEAFACTVPSSSAVIARVMKNTVAATNLASNATTTGMKTAGVMAGKSLGKIIAIILCAVAVVTGGIFAVVGLSDRDKDDEKETTKEVSQDVNSDDNSSQEDETSADNEENEDDKEDEPVQKWYYEETEIPKLSEVKGTLVTYGDNLEDIITDTPFDYTVDEVMDSLLEIPYFKERNCEFANYVNELVDMSYYAEYGARQYEVIDTIECYDGDNVNSDNFLRFDSFVDIELTRNVPYYNNYNNIRVCFSEIVCGRESMEYVEATLAVLCGEELAHYLVYTENLESLTVNNTTYYFERDISDVRDAEEMSVRVVFEIMVINRENQGDMYSFYEGDYDSLIDDINISVADVIKGDFGTTDILDLNNFGSTYMSHVIDEVYEYTTAAFSSDTYRVMILEYPDGLTKYVLNVSVAEYFGASLMVSPELYMSIVVEMREGAITEYSINIEGSTGVGIIEDDDAPIDYSRIYPSLIAKLKSILGDVDLSQFTYENTLDEDGESCEYDSLTYTDTYFDMEADVKVEYEFFAYEGFGDTYGADFEIMITSK